MCSISKSGTCTQRWATISRHFTIEKRPYTFWVWLIYSLGLLGGSLIPGKSVPAIALLGWDKLAHAVVFAGLAALTVPLVSSHRWWLCALLSYGALMGILTEVLQLIPPGRTFSLYDTLADLIGVGLYAAMVMAELSSRRQTLPMPGEVISPNLDS